MNKRTLSNSKEIYTRGGAVAASDWTSGSGRYITKRAIPPFCVEVNVDFYFRNIDDEKLKQIPLFNVWSEPKLEKLPVYAMKAVKKLLKERPKIKKIILMVDRRGFKKALKAKEVAA